MVTGTSSWDVESLLKHAGASDDSACLRAVLSHIDAALHTQPQASRQTYGQALNRAKLRLLRGVDDPTARAVLQVQTLLVHAMGTDAESGILFPSGQVVQCCSACVLLGVLTICTTEPHAWMCILTLWIEFS